MWLTLLSQCDFLITTFSPATNRCRCFLYYLCLWSRYLTLSILAASSSLPLYQPASRSASSSLRLFSISPRPGSQTTLLLTSSLSLGSVCVCNFDPFWLHASPSFIIIIGSSCAFVGSWMGPVPPLPLESHSYQLLTRVSMPHSLKANYFLRTPPPPLPPANTKHLYNNCTMLSQRRRRWSTL